jgi:hypothetical protein
MFSHGVPFWSVALAGTQPLFDGITFLQQGTVRTCRAARGRGALSQYGSGRFPERGRHAARHKYGHGRALDAATAAESAAKVTLDLTREQRRAGFVNRWSAERGAGLSAGASRPRQQGVSTRQHVIKPWAAAGGTAVQARSASRRAPANPRHVCRHCTTDGAAATIVLVVASARPSDVSSVASAGHPFVTSRALLQRSEQKRSGLERQGRIRRPRPASGMDTRPKKHQQELEPLR